MKKILIMLAVFSAFTMPSAGAVLENAVLIFPALEIGAGPRALGMGEAFTALSDDASAIYWNPAGMARLDRAKITGTYDKWFDDMFYDYIAGAIPFGNGGGMGFSLFYMNLGRFEQRDSLGAVIPGDLTSYFLSASLGYAQGVGENFTMGISSKFFVQDSRIGGAIDAGLLLKFGAFSIGLTGQNIGAGEDHPLPVIIKGGLAYRLLDTQEHSLILAADARGILKDTVYFMFGGEYGIARVFYLRGGYEISGAEKTLNGLTGLSGGVGLNLNPLQFDYAIVPYGNLGTTHRMALTLSFGEVTNTKAPGKKRGLTSEAVTKARELYREGITLETAKKYTEAAAKYSASLRINSADANSWKRLGIALYKAGKKDYAKKALETALKLDPADVKLRAFLERYK